MKQSKKIMTRIAGTALAAAMTFSIVPTTASEVHAQEMITLVGPALDFPMAGYKPDYTFNDGTDENGNLVQEPVKFSREKSSVIWYEYIEDGEDRVLQTNDEFEFGKKYYADAILAYDDNKYYTISHADLRFHLQGAISSVREADNVSPTLSMKDGYSYYRFESNIVVCGDYIGENSGTYAADPEIVWKGDSSKTLKEITSADKPSDFNFYIDFGFDKYFTLEKTEWFEKGKTTKLKDSDRFEAGKEYTLKVTLGRLEGKTAFGKPVQLVIERDDLKELYKSDNNFVTSEDGKTASFDLTFGPVKKAKYDITFDANGGKGTMDKVTAEDGDSYALPECKFTAPEGKEFDKWDKGAVGTKITITANTTVKAIWKDKKAEVKPTPEQKQTPTPEPKPTPAAPKTGDKVKDEANKTDYKVVVPGSTAEFSGTTNADTKKVVIPDTVTINGVKYKIVSVSANAFKNNKKITEVIIGKNVQTIGANAFSGCSNLKTVKFGSKVTSIGNSAFAKCTSLTKITIPASVKKIGKNAFNGCKNLKNINIKTTKLTKNSVGANAFKGIHTKAVAKVPKKKINAYTSILRTKGMKSKKQKITK
jgi:hypothetical protein